MTVKAKRLLRGFIDLDEKERKEFIDELNKYQNGTKELRELFRKASQWTAQ